MIVKFTIDKPDVLGRREIFLVYLKRIKTTLDKESLSKRLAAVTPGFTGADIANICNEAALYAARVNAQTVTSLHFDHAIERVIAGLEKITSIIT